MSVVEHQALEAAIPVVEMPERLSAITEKNSAALIWRRDMPADVLTWLDALSPKRLPSTRLVLRPASVGKAVEQIFDATGMPRGPERSWLEGDIADLAQRFADIMSAPYLRLRLQAVATDACRKFHIDAITARLICTYRGPGTQFGISDGGDEPEHPAQVATGVPMILRGTRWPSDPPAGLVHRSPPIAGTGTTRFVLVIDPVEALEDEM